MKLTAFEKILIAIGILILWPFFLSAIATRRTRSLETKRKVKYFRPTVEQSFWGRKVSWELRNKPLTKKQIKKLSK